MVCCNLDIGRITQDASAVTLPVCAPLMLYYKRRAIDPRFGRGHRHRRQRPRLSGGERVRALTEGVDLDLLDAIIKKEGHRRHAVSPRRKPQKQLSKPATFMTETPRFPRPTSPNQRWILPTKRCSRKGFLDHPVLRRAFVRSQLFCCRRMARAGRLRTRSKHILSGFGRIPYAPSSGRNCDQCLPSC
jgi:hypothetical protein